VVIALEGSQKKTSKQVILGFFLPVARFRACPAGWRWRQAPLMLTLGTSLAVVEWKEANSGCGHHLKRVQNEISKQVILGCFLPVARFRACPAGWRCRQAPLTLTLGTSLAVVEWKEANSGCGHHLKRVQNEISKQVVLPVARFRACPAGRRW